MMSFWTCYRLCNGPLDRYVKLRVAHAPGMPGTFSPPPRVSDPDMHHGTCVTHVPWCMPGSLTSDFHWSRWWGKRSLHSRRMRNPQFYISGKRPWATLQWGTDYCGWKFFLSLAIHLLVNIILWRPCVRSIPKSIIWFSYGVLMPMETYWPRICRDCNQLCVHF